MPLPHPELGRAWAAARPAAAGLHLDSAACGRSSEAVLAAVAAHARLEARAGAHAADLAAGPALARTRTDLGALFGLAADDIAFAESAAAAAATLFACWPGLGPGSRVVVAATEYGPNLALLADLGVTVHVLPGGVADPADLERALAAAPTAFVHLTPLGSYDGTVQPAADLAGCARAGVPVVVDAAQAAGQLDLTGVRADAVYGTSRKWLAGPRGVGFIGLTPAAAAVMRPRGLAASNLPAAAGTAQFDGPPARLLESREAHVAGRIGLGTAVAEHLAAGPVRIHERLGALGAAVREASDGVAGWRVLPGQGAVATTTLLPPDGGDAAATRMRLLTDHGIVTTWADTARAPLRARRDGLRISPHVDTTEDDIAGFVRALAAAG